MPKPPRYVKFEEECSKKTPKNKEELVELRICEFIKIYRDTFIKSREGKNKILYSEKMISKIDYKIVSKNEWPNICDKYAKYIDDEIIKFYPKCAPDIVYKELTPFHNLRGEDNNYDGRRDLSGEEKKHLLSKLFEAREVLRVDLKITNSFYSPNEKKIYFKDDVLTDWAIAHEMAHYFSHDRWQKLLTTLVVREVPGVEYLNEGMADNIALQVYEKWLNQVQNLGDKQSIDLIKMKDKEWWDKSHIYDAFYKIFSSNAYLAYFEGTCGVTKNAKERLDQINEKTIKKPIPDEDKVENNLLIGNSKKWAWWKKDDIKKILGI